MTPFLKRKKAFICRILLIFRLYIYKSIENRLINLDNLIAEVCHVKSIEKEISLSNSKIGAKQIFDMETGKLHVKNHPEKWGALIFLLLIFRCFLIIFSFFLFFFFGFCFALFCLFFSFFFSFSLLFFLVLFFFFQIYFSDFFMKIRCKLYLKALCKILC